MNKTSILEESKKRVGSIVFGNPVTNICAGESNPMFHSYFVKYIVKSRKSKFGITHKEYLARCTDKNGRFWDIGIEVIYPGHLNREEANRLFRPVWEIHFNNQE